MFLKALSAIGTLISSFAVILLIIIIIIQKFCIVLFSILKRNTALLYILLVATINRLLILPFLVHAGSFRVSVIHRTPGSLTCIRDHFYACVYTRGLSTPTVSQHNILDSEKLTRFFLVLSGSNSAFPGHGILE